MNVRVLPAARRDLIAIDDYLIANFGPAFAVDTRKQLQATFKLLHDFPQLGVVRADLTRRAVRFFAHPPYWIIYRPGTPLRIYRIYHGARDLARLPGLR